MTYIFSSNMTYIFSNISYIFSSNTTYLFSSNITYIFSSNMTYIFSNITYTFSSNMTYIFLNRTYLLFQIKLIYFLIFLLIFGVFILTRWCDIRQRFAVFPEPDLQNIELPSSLRNGCSQKIQCFFYRKFTQENKLSMIHISTQID